MEGNNNSSLFTCYLYFLRKYIKNCPKSMLFDQHDHQWIKTGLKEYLRYKQDYYPNKFYQITLDDIDNLKSEIKNIGTLTLRKWNNQPIIIIGCGNINIKDGGKFLTKNHYQVHAHEHDSDNEYLVDTDITILPDMCIAVCQQSLSKAMPEAHGKIKEIIVEGICLEETDIFFNDCKLLLAEDGLVITNHDIPILIKQKGEIFFIHDDNELELYEPWTQEDINNKTYGFDIFDWTGQFVRNGWRIENFKNTMMSKHDATKYIKEIEK